MIVLSVNKTRIGHNVLQVLQIGLGLDCRQMKIERTTDVMEIERRIGFDDQYIIFHCRRVVVACSVADDFVVESGQGEPPEVDARWHERRFSQFEPLQNCRRNFVKSSQRIGLNRADCESSAEDVCHSVAVHVITEDW